MVFCNLMMSSCLLGLYPRHNPYFNRWFSAIAQFANKGKEDKYLSHNPYFNRWFSAINGQLKLRCYMTSHNPYFNRWFSAIQKQGG